VRVFSMSDENDENVGGGANLRYMPRFVKGR